LILAQADLVIVCGAQLDLQQTGFDVDNFAPNAQLFQIFPSPGELNKPKPRLAGGINADPDTMLKILITKLADKDATEWLDYAVELRRLVPVLEPANRVADGYVLSFAFLQRLSMASNPEDLLAMCSSGGTFTGALQMYHIKPRQYASTSAAFASMGYGLGTAIGMSFAWPGRRVIATEGDGGFSQNLQELAMVRRFNLPIKFFLLQNDGYASIRATQRKFFNGAYVGCDPATGLGFPDWVGLFNAYGIPCSKLTPEQTSIENLSSLLNQTEGPEAFVVPIDPEQTNWPAVSSRMLPDGRLISAPIYDMLPQLPAEVQCQVTRYLP
jgi:acetolactate synthase-1/2/3 large subunit